VGACYLTTYNWELTQHYELGREILCYRDKDELIEMISFYRSRPEDCLRIAQAAWRRCTAEHTWERRFRRVFREVGFEV
jgi:spore maturation protein CgeB